LPPFINAPSPCWPPTTAKDDIYAFVFGQKGLMAGIGTQGNKFTKITPKS